MSKESNITAADRLFAGEKKTLRYLTVDENGDPLDMTGYTLQWTMEGRKDRSDVLTKDTSGGGGIVIANGNGTNDAAEVTIDAADTMLRPPATYRYALWRVDAGSEALLAEGAIVLQQAAMRDT